MTSHRSSTSLTLTLALVACLSVSACATKPDRRGPPDGRESGKGRGGPERSSGTFMQPIGTLFAGMDTNQDKQVSLNEMRTGTQSEWISFGRNPSAIYFSQWSVENLGSTDAMPTFMSFDRDFSGTISEEEFTSQLENQFQRLDKNGDGSVERSEMIVAFAAPQGQQSRGSAGGREKGEKGGRGGGRPPR